MFWGGDAERLLQNPRNRRHEPICWDDRCAVCAVYVYLLFPTRNRVIAGLCDVLLVVEAGIKGGALITARIALDYGVPVYATPGDVDRVASFGTNLLIRDGAFPILGPDDLTEVLGLLAPLYESPAAPSGEAAGRGV
jgi:predicted Rossmann fold nucleotide-binding protein DprA/Smf involved in DNA uptake